VFSARFVTVGGSEIPTRNERDPSMAQNWVSFEEVKSRVSIQDVLTHYGLMEGTTEKSSKHGTELRLHCPFHEDSTPSLSINAATGKFHCFGCHAKGGDIFDFVVAKEDINAGDRTKSRRKAALLIQDWSGGAPAASPAPQPSAAVDTAPPVEDVAPAAEEPEGPSNTPLKFAFKHLDTRHSYLLEERGLTAATIDFFGLGLHAGKGIMQGRVVIPIHNDQGVLVAYAGRSPGDPPEGEGKETIASLPGFGMALEGPLSYSCGPNMRARRTQLCSVRERIDPIPARG
jgi:DNA primase